MMKKLLKALLMIILGALGAAIVLYIDAHCPKKQAERQNQINAMIGQYIKTHSQDIFELITKNENFGRTIQNFSGRVSDDVLKQQIHEYIQNNPSISSLSEEIQNDSENEEENNLFKEHWNEIINNQVAPSVGPKDAKVTVVEFFDFACGHCKALAPIMSQIMKSNKDVRFIFEPLFFISEHSPYAAKASLAAAKKGKFVEVYEGIMTLPNMSEATIDQILKDEGLNVDEIKKMIEEKDIRRGVQDIDSLSQVLGVNGVPMLLINGEPFYGRTLADIQKKIDSLK